MKRTLNILVSVGLVSLLLFIRLLFSQQADKQDERHWFAKALRYEFSAQVDSVQMLNAHIGKYWCRITEGNPEVNREDSLKRFFKDHDMLYLIFHRSGDSINFVISKGDLLAKGDSVRFSSKQNTIAFFRAGQSIGVDSLSASLIGYSKPFFMRRK
jgi:hypothetical protein